MPIVFSIIDFPFGIVLKPVWSIYTSILKNDPIGFKTEGSKCLAENQQFGWRDRGLVGVAGMGEVGW